LLTPALNILGFQMVHAIGTGFFTLMGKTLFAATRHHRLGNLDLKLGITVGLFSAPGVELGKRLVLHLERLHLAGVYVRVAYIVLLVLISIFMLKENYHYWSTKQNERKKIPETQESRSAFTRLAYRIRLSPRFSLRGSGTDSISLWVIIASGMIIGFLSGFMGLGGGFIALPFLIYVIGVPTITAVGTSLVIVFLISCYGTAVYAIGQYVEWIPALIILAGSLIGVQFGVYATKYVTGMKIKVLFALLLLVVAVSVFLKQINMATFSTWLILSSACALCLAIVFPVGKSLLTRNNRRGRPRPQV